MTNDRRATFNNTFAIGGVSCSADSSDSYRDAIAEIQFSASTFVLKVATFAKPETALHTTKATTQVSNFCNLNNFSF
jgi:hypothetical protein